MLVMKRKMVSAVTLTLLLIGMLTLAFNIQPVKASGTIYIRADGTIDPSTAPISTADNITYTLADNIYDKVVIERSSIIIDGDGCTINSYELTGVSNVRIENTIITNGYQGVYLNSSSGIVLCGNIITKNYEGVLLYRSSNNIISGNIIALNTAYNIYLNESSSNVIVKNHVGGLGSYGSEHGIEMSKCSNNTIMQNNITLCKRAIRVEGFAPYGEDASNNTIMGNSIEYYEYGIRLSHSSNNTIMQNNITSIFPVPRGTGIFIYGNFNLISENSISSNEKGISLGGSKNNSISQNNIENNFCGIEVSGNPHYPEQQNNRMHHNNFINNIKHARIYGIPPINTWDDGYPSGGNYWSRYTGVDIYLEAMA
jgi:parallel beta-helix repeat protein